MARFMTSTAVAAPVDEVWDFHDRLDGLADLTSEWLGIEVIPLDGPNAPLEAGTTFEISVDPLGLGPRTVWRGRVTSVRRRPDRGRFVDVGVDTPFDGWRHVHTVRAVSDGTLVTDELSYRNPPGGRLGAVALRFGVPLGFLDRRRRLTARFGRLADA